MTARASLHRGAEGFTLVELLVAITLIALLTIGLYQAFGIGTRAASTVSTNIDRPAQIALAYDFMRRASTGAEPLPAGTDPSQAAINFDGESQTLSFVALPPAYLAIGGFQRLHLGLEPGKDGARLIVAWEGVARGPIAPQPEMLQPSVLIDQVRNVAFAYFGVPGPKQKAAWLDRWSERDALPQLIRMRLRPGRRGQAHANKLGQRISFRPAIQPRGFLLRPRNPEIGESDVAYLIDQDRRLQHFGLRGDGSASEPSQATMSLAPSFPGSSPRWRR